MAWRPQALLRNGVLDNTKRGVITGELEFYGMAAPVQVKLKGDFHRDVRGAKLLLKAREEQFASWQSAQQQMQGFATLQTGVAGDITAGLEPFDYTNYPYIEWYSETNGRVCLEFDEDDVTVIGTPLPWQQEAPNNPNRSRALLEEFVGSLAAECGGVGIILKRR